MKVYWDKTAVIGLVGFTISLADTVLYGLSQPPIGGDIPLPVWHLTLRNIWCSAKSRKPRKTEEEGERKREREG